MPPAEALVAAATVGSTGDALDRDLVVLDRRPLADGVVGLRLADPDGDLLPPWEPGAHIDLVLSPERVRQYSLCGDPADRTSWSIAVLREPEGRGGSAHIHDRLGAATTVRVRGPRNHFRLESGGPYLFVAGGIGITPILPMVREAEADGATWELLYGGRSRRSMAFAAPLAALGPRVRIHPQDSDGLLPVEAALDRTGPSTQVYACGPGPMLDAVHAACARRGRGLHLERFRPRTALDVGRDGFEVELARSGRVLHVPAGRSLLEVLEEAGVQILSSCRTGTCGTCEVDVLTGDPEHHDEVLSDDERAAGDVLLACTARSRSPRLVLDC